MRLRLDAQREREVGERAGDEADDLTRSAACNVHPHLGGWGQLFRALSVEH